jgi:hypothetical protein
VDVFVSVWVCLEIFLKVEDLELGLVWFGLVQKMEGIKGRCCGFVASAQGGVDPA